MPDLTVSPDEQGLSLLDFLQRRIPAAPLGYLRQLLKQGKILAGTTALGEEVHVTGGMTLHLPASGRLREFLATVPPPEVAILLESRELLIVDKSAGVAIHAGLGHETDNLTCRIEALLQRRGERFQVAPIHRLDLETSGPVLFGKGRKACAALGKLFMEQAVEKRYLALVAGQTPDGDVLRSLIPAKGKEKEAVTAFRTLAQNKKASLLDIRLHSGRQHQIRIQLADAGHPLFGDRRYHGPCPSTLPRLFLHCRSLGFIDPFSGAPVAVTSPLPSDLAAFLATCDLALPAAAGF